ncbi:MAG: hypothetical protein JWN79_3275 [Gemmatimonadetes bacterium]|jgi:two-component system cell cycle sensor histidine kinase/response regulator CckA|nr:hypothetical protein [Gemmatimonadota bacterium]
MATGDDKGIGQVRQLQPSERYIVETALRDSEARHELLFHSAPGPMWVLDVESMAIHAVNDAALAQYGYSRDEFLQLTLRDLRTPGSRAAFWRVQRAMLAGQDVHGIYKHRRRDGSVLDVEVRTSTLPIGDGRLRLILATDVTEPKRGADSARFLDKASGILMASLEHDFLCRNLATLAVPALGDWCVVHRHMDGDTLALCGYAHALPAGQALIGELFDDRVRPAAGTPLHRAWRDASVIELTGAAAYAAVSASLGEPSAERLRLLTIEAVLFVPIIGRGGTLGVLECVMGGTERSFDAATRALAIALAERAALAMGNALRYADARAAAIARVAPVPQSHDAAQSAAWMAESIPDGYMALDATWTLTYANSEAERIFGRPREELVGHTLWTLFPEAVGSVFEVEYRRARDEQRPVMFEAYYQGLDMWFEVHARPTPQTLAVFFRDITRHRRALARQAEDEAQYRDLVESANDLIHMLSPDGRVLYANRAWRDTLGYTEEEVRKLTVARVVAPESLALSLSRQAEAMKGGTPRDTDLTVVRKDGTRLVVRGRSNWRFVDGVPVNTRSIYRDVTAEVQARELLARAQRTEASAYRAKTAFLDRMSHEMRTPLTAVLGFAGILEHNRAGTLSAREVDFARRIGVQARTLLGLIEDVLAYADIEARRVDLLVTRVDVHALLREVTSLYREDAARATVELSLELPDEPVEVETDRTVLQRVMRYLLSDAVPRAEGGRVVVRLAPPAEGGTYTITVRAESRDADLHAGTPVDATQPAELSLTIAESLAALLGFPLTLRQLGRGITESTVRLGGETARPVASGDNSAKTLHAILVASPLPIIAFDPDWTVRVWNEAAEALYGWTPRDVIERRLPMLRGEDDEAFRALLRQALEAPRGIADVPAVHRRKDGTVVDVHVSLAPLRAPDGRLRGFLGIVTDVSERTRLADELRQAQRMEVIGRLAGGIAHDFNNLLTVISTHAQFLMQDLPAESPLMEDAEAIQESSARAAALTRQLLLFTRRQSPIRRLVDLNTMLANVDRILRRMLGSHVEFVTLPFRVGVCVEADPGQIEQVMMNLILNARDAMPSGGALVAEVGKSEEGGRHFATLTVSDTGIGMDAATQERIYEPFFTTKGPDRGTGLGLATVYSIVTESGGGIDVDSQPGVGTTFRVRFPLAEGAIPSPVAADDEGSLLGAETVLLVEDQDAVRTVAARALRAYGYTVLLARHGRDALEVLRTAPAVHLLLTDLMMPEMSGSELAEHVRALRPEVRILFMSGYSETPVSLTDGHADIPLVRKPFAGDTLARAVREALDA